MLKTNLQICTVLEKSKGTTLQFSKGTAKVLHTEKKQILNCQIQNKKN